MAILFCEIVAAELPRKKFIRIAGRGKPGWGRESTRPVWWPKELPWANVRMDARTEQEKQKVIIFYIQNNASVYGILNVYFFH